MKTLIPLVTALALVVSAGAQVIDGTRDGLYGSALTTQTVQTQFGDNFSELDAGYGLISGGFLYLFLSGNLEANGNNINLYIADGRAGQSTLSAVNTGNSGANDLAVVNGTQFSPGFSATYAFNINNSGTTLKVNQYNLFNNTSVNTLGSLTTSGGIGSGTVDNSVLIGFNNNNSAGVLGGTAAADQAAANLVATGLELAIPLSLLGNPSGSINVLADVNGGSEGFLSNQFLPGRPAGTGNLGSAGIFNFSATPGQFFTVPVPEPSTAVLFGLSGLATLFAIRRRK